ncbi:MAG: S8 family peptidase [Bacteroidetes bacterium]|nr:S8 family peptidase [Bacteroidota bacterium]
MDSFRSQSATPNQYILRFQNLPDAVAQKNLAHSGIRLLSYLGQNSYTALIQPEGTGTVPGLLSARAMNPIWKMGRELVERLNTSDKIPVIFSCVPGISEVEVAAQLKRFEAELKPMSLGKARLFQALISARNLKQFAAWPGLVAINAAASPQPLNVQSERATKVNVAQAPVAAGGYNLLGDSIAVGVGDNNSGLYHVDTRDRVTNFNFLAYANHGQHVNGTVGGAGTGDPAAQGFAPHVNLLDHTYTNVWTQTGEMLQHYNMSVTNNSYANIVGSCSYAGSYDLYAQYLDSIALAYPSVMHVFAAGNDGSMTCAPFTGGYGTVCGGFQTSKNVLVVANAQKTNVLWGSSSKGPLKDGRLRPDITAIGYNVYSTKGNDAYLLGTGTSMASPQVSGASALLQQHYKRLHSDVYPPAMLTKALLMNGAMDLGNSGPDFIYGYGMMDLRQSLLMLDHSWFDTGHISQGNSQTPTSISVPANTAELKVMLLWPDPAASTSAATQLVNDLDLKLTDPSSTIHLPFILNPASPSSLATTGADHLNNAEQIVIKNPASGTYSVGVTGYSVPFGPQTYTIVYNIIPKGISISAPFKGGAYKANDASNALGIYWDASDGTNTFTIEYSTNSGSTWTTLSSSVAAGDRYFNWIPSSGINSANCYLRITRNVTLETATEGPFTINDQPVLQLFNNQCPGYVNIHWSPVGNATSYRIWRKNGYYLQPLTSTTDTFFYASGLRRDSIYYFAVAPLFSGTEGYRSLAVSRMPDTGTCVGSYSNNDLMMDSLFTPATGRLNTSTAFSNAQTLTLRVRNLDDAACSSYKVSIKLNNGSWQSQTLSSLAANSSVLVSFTGQNMAASSDYQLQAAVENLSASDPVPANDTLFIRLRQLQNTALNLLSNDFTDSFESLPAMSLLRDTMGFSANQHWDYFNDNDTGRLRSFVDDQVTINGTRSLSMDMLFQRATPPAFNRVVGTFNLSSYGSSNEIRLEFDYRLHGKPKWADSNKVFIRGNDAQVWLPLTAYDLTASAGVVKHTPSISLTDALNAASQSFSSSTQLAFGQRDTGVIAAFDNANGVTIDNIRIYLVSKDIGLSAVTAPSAVNCGMSSNTTLTVSVFNGVTTAANNIGMYYQLDGGSVVHDSLSSLAGKANTSFSFTQQMNTSTQGQHIVKVWCSYAGDDSPSNDTLYFTFHNEPFISSFPYLEDFESNNGYWWSEGQNNSWAWGTPASPKIHDAPSGNKVWKTKLNGYYNTNELSYLYSPCFDISSLSNPTLSFAVNMEIENCGSSLCDAAWLEYSIGSGAWTKLGAYGQGTNWYNDSTHQVWDLDSSLRWRVASIALPATSQPIRFRFVMSSDAGTEYEGLAIDLIHVYNLSDPIDTSGAAGPISNTVSGSSYTDFLNSGALLAQISAGNSNSLGTTSVQVYTHSNLAAPSGQQYFLPRNFVINTQNAPTDSVSVRLYVTDSDVIKLVNATGCSGCSKPNDVFELGITKYDDATLSNENGSLTDNTAGGYMFIPSSKIAWVPYNKGYYASLKLTSFSELWFNNGGAAGVFPLPLASIQFQAQKSGEQNVLIHWLCLVDTQVGSYELERSTDAHHWGGVATVAPVHNNAHSYQYTDQPGNIHASAFYYRLKYMLQNGRTYYSEMRQVIWDGGHSGVRIYPNPVHGVLLNLEWNTQPGATMQAKLTDVSGLLVREWSATAPDYSNVSGLDFSGIGSGVYFLHVQIDGEPFILKVIHY